MRLASDIHPTAPLANPILGEEGATPQERYADYKIIRRNGAVVAFEPDKISIAMTKAFLAVAGNTAAASAGVRDKVQALVMSASILATSSGCFAPPTITWIAGFCGSTASCTRLARSRARSSR